MSRRRSANRGVPAVALHALMLAAALQVPARGAEQAPATRMPADAPVAPPNLTGPAAQDPTGPASAAASGARARAPGDSNASATLTLGSPPGSGAAPADAAEDIRDIRGPKYVYPPWLLPALLAAVMLLALAAYGAWRWLRHRRRPRALLPFERTLEELEGIRPLMQPATVREFSIAVSDIIRRYIELRFDVTATHQTTEEFLRDLLETAKPSLARHRGLLSAFLQQCDLVKFAGVSLSLQSMESLHQSARAFVLETAKPDAAQPSPASSSSLGPVRKEAHDSLPSA